ncbi:hypothetical protein ABKN59_004583 [Abortiporus biennis]
MVHSFVLLNLFIALFLNHAYASISIATRDILTRSLETRQLSFNPDNIPAECSSKCKSTVAVLSNSTCITPSCLCTSSVNTGFQTCMNCLLASKGNVPADIQQDQQAISSFEDSCGNVGISLTSLTVGGPASTSATAGTSASTSVSQSGISSPVENQGADPNLIPGSTQTPTVSGNIENSATAATAFAQHVCSTLFIDDVIQILLLLMQHILDVLSKIMHDLRPSSLPSLRLCLGRYRNIVTDPHKLNLETSNRGNSIYGKRFTHPRTYSSCLHRLQLASNRTSSYGPETRIGIDSIERRWKISSRELPQNSRKYEIGVRS